MRPSIAGDAPPTAAALADAAAGDAAATVALSLISHTNTGKTTLARTLLGRDVGTVRDAQHVTDEASAWPLVETGEGDVLMLWDTPGFGDSARLARRLAREGSPVGWFLTQVWDRFRDRALYLAQQAVRNVRERADVVLYLVNAAESPADAGYLAPELDVLAYIGKPVVVLLNQVGPPRPREEEEADLARWREAVGARALVRAVASLDAFTRCWVQEIALLDLVTEALPPAQRGAGLRLADAWRARRLATFDASMQVLAEPIAAAALDREPVEGSGGVLANLVRRMVTPDAAKTAQQRAGEALVQRLERNLRESFDALIAQNGLDGRAGRDVLARLATTTAVDAPVDEGKAAIWGGAVSGALSGLAADVAAGGLTFGAGLVAGAILGALGGAGVARGINLATGRRGSELRFDAALLAGLVQGALLRYLAVAHYGRGRGEWREGEYPAFWRDVVAAAVDRRRDALAALFARPAPEAAQAAATQGSAEQGPAEQGSQRAAPSATLAPDVAQVLAQAAREVLEELYPGTRAFAGR